MSLLGARYVVRCDECRRVMRSTADIQDAYNGGLCEECERDLARREEGK